MTVRAARPLALAIVFVLMFASFGAAAAKFPDFTKLVRQASPSVVNISTTQRIGSNEYPNMPNFEQAPFGDWFRHFFGDQFPPGDDEQPEGESEDHGPMYEARSLGSGFIISTDGYVLTNYHVVRDADEIIVTLSDRRQFPAEVVGMDELSDIALLKIDAQELPVADIGSSARLDVGEWVLAIGSPYGFDHSVTAGIVSAKRRSLRDEQYVPFIQTDVAINPGNSGGPLLNTSGKVVGINSQIYSRTGGYMGLSFAIPIDVAMQVAEQLKENGRVVRGWLGVVIQSVDRGLAESFGMERPTGALVARVLPDSPADQAGIRVGDVILSFGGQPVDTSGALPPLVGRTQPGDEVKVKVLRNGERQTVTVTIGALPENPGQATTQPETEPEETRLGLTVRDLKKEQRDRLGVEQGGVLVTKVASGAALSAGIQEGDVILQLDGEPVEDAAGFRQRVEKLPAGEAVAVLIQRRGQPLFLALEVPEEGAE